MEVKTTGLLERLNAKAVLGLPVEQEDVIALAEINNHNAAKITELSNKLDSVIYAVTLGFDRVNGCIKSFNETNAAQEQINKSLADDLADTISTFSDDLDGVYEDMNGHLGGETDDAILVRRSEVVEEDEIIETDPVGDSVTTALLDGTPINVNMTIMQGDVEYVLNGVSLSVSQGDETEEHF